MSSPPAAQTLPIRVEFSGGLESLFHNQRSHTVSLPLTSTAPPPTIATLVTHLTATFLAAAAPARRELFVLDGAVRPGILVLVNDADWELEGEGACVLEAGDEVLFVSTLHGG